MNNKEQAYRELIHEWQEDIDNLQKVMDEKKEIIEEIAEAVTNNQYDNYTDMAADLGKASNLSFDLNTLERQIQLKKDSIKMIKEKFNI